MGSVDASYYHGPSVGVTTTADWEDVPFDRDQNRPEGLTDIPMPTSGPAVGVIINDGDESISYRVMGCPYDDAPIAHCKEIVEAAEVDPDEVAFIELPSCPWPFVRVQVMDTNPGDHSTAKAHLTQKLV